MAPTANCRRDRHVRPGCQSHVAGQCIDCPNHRARQYLSRVSTNLDALQGGVVPIVCRWEKWTRIGLMSKLAGRPKEIAYGIGSEPCDEPANVASTTSEAKLSSRSQPPPESV